jgi:hypothetical protein
MSVTVYELRFGRAPGVMTPDSSQHMVDKPEVDLRELAVHASGPWRGQILATTSRLQLLQFLNRLNCRCLRIIYAAKGVRASDVADTNGLGSRNPRNSCDFRKAETYATKLHHPPFTRMIKISFALGQTVQRAQKVAKPGRTCPRRVVESPDCCYSDWSSRTLHWY